ncbi:MAG: hypothetical protein B6U68_02000 [Candidatus Aenigmarchaeota archaeon ex4484_14]|nr:MAG: hypothetical protein B6U68_02000 [Candidatus Aenigmarchaeota archaeon ex4484_14]
MSFQLQLLTALIDIGNEFINFLPNLVGAALIALLGLFIGKLLGKAVKHILEKARLDYYISETEKPTISLVDIFSLITRWWVYLVFLTQAINILGLDILVTTMGRINEFIPNVIGATLILVVGYVIAEYIKEQIKKNKTIYASIMGKMVFFFIILVTIALALPVLGISAGLLNNILVLMVASIAIGIAIALGLGLKDAVSDISRAYVKKYVKKSR